MARPSRKDEILQAALACFTEHGVDVTTIEMIRDRSGASNSLTLDAPIRVKDLGDNEGAVSSNGLLWPGLWPSIRRSCCWMSRSATWTLSCGRGCASN